GDRWRHSHRGERLRTERHACEQDRRELPGRRVGPRAVFAPLPRRDPARHQPGREPRRTADRARVRPAQGSALMAAVEPVYSLQTSGRARRRLRTNRLMEAFGTGAALLAVGVLALVVATVLVRAWPALRWSLFTQTP